MRVVDGRGYPALADGIIGRYHSENGMDPAGPHGGARILLAVEGEEAVGFVSFRRHTIDALYAADGAPEDTEERLLRAVKAVMINEGRPSLSIHSVDPEGRAERACRRMGFIEDGTCPCCQRDGAVCLNLRF